MRRVDPGPSVGGELDVAVGVERRDDRVVRLDDDVVHRANPYAGSLYRVTGLQARHVAEDR
jgi:hypothetical protein